MEDEIVLPETPKPEDEIDLTNLDDVDRLKETNKRLYERAKKAEAETKALRAKTSDTIIKSDESPHGVKPSDILRADEFKLYRQGYSEQEIDLIMHNGGMKALADDKSPLVLGLKVAKEQRQAEEAATKAQDTSGMSELERKYSKADLDKMSVAELEKILPHAN